MSWLNDYLAFTKRQESPTIFHYWDAIATIAATTNRKIWLPRVSDGIERYKIFPGQLMVVLVAGSGRLRKSTSIKLPQWLLRKANINTLAGATSPEKFLAMLGGVGPHSKQGIVTVIASELAVFLSRQNYATHLVTILNDLADAPDHSDFPTIGRGDVSVNNACVTMLAATTPVDLADAIPPSALQRGFSSRIVFVYANQTDRKESLSETKIDPARQAAAEQARNSLLFGLQAMGQLSGPFDFTDDGRKWYDDWYDVYSRDNDEESEGWGARRHDHMLRVAMVLQVAKNRSMLLDVDCLQRADRALIHIEAHLPDVFAQVGIHQATASGIDRILAVFKKAGGTVDNFTLMEKCMHYFADFNQLNFTIKGLTQMGWLKLLARSPSDIAAGRQVFVLTRPTSNGGPPKGQTGV